MASSSVVVRVSAATPRSVGDAAGSLAACIYPEAVRVSLLVELQDGSVAVLKCRRMPPTAGLVSLQRVSVWLGVRALYPDAVRAVIVCTMATGRPVPIPVSP